jgi:hypothetical protein
VPLSKSNLPKNNPNFAVLNARKLIEVFMTLHVMLGDCLLQMYMKMGGKKKLGEIYRHV